MIRSTELPKLPGFNFNHNVGQQRFHKSQHFLRVNNQPLLTECIKPGIGGFPLPGTADNRYPSFFVRGESIDQPPWLAFDKQVLCFDGFFQATIQEVFDKSAFQIRPVKIYFYLEDGTIQVVEPKYPNSGIPQGTLISRQRIRLPAPRHNEYYDIIDFNIGKNIEFYGKIFKLTNCDRFTRVFLNRSGIPVPDPINEPDDPNRILRKTTEQYKLPKKPNRTVDTLAQFLEHDRHVLRFFGYWDDRESEYGMMHDLEVHYFLADDTIEIKEVVASNLGRDVGAMFLRRQKLPKSFPALPTPGETNPSTILNVLGTGLQGGRFLVDSLNCGKGSIEYYKDNDLTIGAALNVYGRKVVLIHCDFFTQEYYRAKYGLDNFSPAPRPFVAEEHHAEKTARVLPPWNGYGTHEDSAVNCRTVDLKPPHRDFNKFFNKDRVGFDSHILKFRARMVSKILENCDRDIIISYFLSDDTISVFERAKRNSGFVGGKFFKRARIPLPGQEYFSVDPPKCYEPQDLFIGGTVFINEFEFVFTGADEYALRYMEINCEEFPKSDIKRIMNKIKESLRPVYKQFVAEYLPANEPVIHFDTLRNALLKYVKDPLTLHEMVTIARYFKPECIFQQYTRNDIRALVLSEIKHNLWSHLDKLEETFLMNDLGNTKCVTQHTAYTICRAARLPIDVDLLNAMLKVVSKNEKGDVFYEDLLNFLNINWEPIPDVVPINIQKFLAWNSEIYPSSYEKIDWCAFNEYLDLEKTITEQQNS